MRGLLPDDASARAARDHMDVCRAYTVEPPILDRGIATLFWSTTRPGMGSGLPSPRGSRRVRTRRTFQFGLAMPTGSNDAFSAGGLLMVTVAAQVERIGSTGEISEPLCLCRPWRMRGPPTSVLSRINWRFSLASHRPADKRPLWARGGHRVTREFASATRVSVRTMASGAVQA